MRAGHGVRFRILLVVCAAIGFAPPRARADWSDFAPRPVENGAYLDVYTSYERDHIRSGGPSNTWSDSFIREKLTLFSDGYSYHPRFMQYRFSISGALKQEDYESSAINTPGWQNDTGFEYDIRMFFLPEHVYNLTAYAARYEPLFKEQVSTLHSAIESTQGVSFRYRKKPYFLYTGYGHDHIDSGLSSSDINRAFIDGEYFKRFTSGNELSFTGAFNPSWFSASGGVDGSTYQYLLGNMVNLQRARLTSNVSKVESDQQGGSFQSFTNDQLSWYELLTVYLPWNFRSDAKYFYLNNDNTIEEPGDLPNRKLSSTNNDFELDVYHRLYESLDTTYTFLDSRRDSSGGLTTFQSNSLSLNYTKIIPWGRFNLGTNVARGLTDTSGEVAVPNESHPGISVPVPGTFPLDLQNVVDMSIDVFINCVPGGDCPPTVLGRVRLDRDVGSGCADPDTGCYLAIADPARNSFTIQVLYLPTDFPVSGTFDFLASYSTSGDFRLRTDTYGVNTSVNLFDNMLTPYFSYITISSDVLAGEFPGVPLDSTTYTAGLLAQRGPLRVRGEYQDFQWSAAPYTSWLAEVQYVSALNPTTSVYGVVSYLNKHYSQGTVIYYGNVTDYTEETITGSASIQKQFYSRNLFVSAGATYSHITGLVDTDAYAANSALIWKVGKVELTVGASVYGSDSSGINTPSTERDHQLFYAKFRRRLF
jgi:hypothetical protein